MSVYTDFFMIVRLHMKCGTYMFFIVSEPLPLDPKCVFEILSRLQRTRCSRDRNDILQTHILSGPGVQCEISA